MVEGDSRAIMRTLNAAGSQSNTLCKTGCSLKWSIIAIIRGSGRPDKFTTAVLKLLEYGPLQNATSAHRAVVLRRHKNRLAGSTYPKSYRLSAGIRMTEHPLAKITGPPQPRLHLGGAVGAALCCLNRFANYLPDCFRSLGLLQ